MLQINEISNQARQRHLIALEGKDRIDLTLEFFPEQYGWFFTLTWGTFATYNERITACSNLLRQYQHILPFGLMITTSNNFDPMTRDCFSSGLASLFILSAAEVADLEATLYA